MRLLQRQSDGKVSRNKNLVDAIPSYAILSHTWAADDEEVSFNDFTSCQDGTKLGYRKIQFCARQAELDGMNHFWIDTCCIDKANHTELSEAIASMYRWYQNAEKCYVYLSDVSACNYTTYDAVLEWENAFCASRWFTRGWTLQELLAPRIVEFFSREGERLGDKTTLERLICRATDIPVQALRGAQVNDFSVQERMSWASRRQTTRKEDRAYCLQGLFGVFIPLIYGEEENAFRRLEKAIDERYMDEIRVISDPGDLCQFRKATYLTRVTDEQDDLLLQSLAFPEMHNRRLNLEPHHEHTCQWILETAEYKQWISTSQGLFWIKGKPGAGKSTVMAFMYDEMQENMRHQMQQSSTIQLAFFFNARGTELQYTFHGMLRSLLHQLFLQDASTSQHIHTVFEDKNKTLGSSPGQWEWQLFELKSLFTEAVVNTGGTRPLVLFVDALDEAGEQWARKISQFLHSLNDQAISTQALVRICISCRHYPFVTSRNTNLEVAVEEHNDKDIATFIRETLCLDQVVNHAPEEQPTWYELELELKRRTQGIFQWIRLVVPLIRRRIDKGESPEWIKRKLRDVPDGLREIYIHILRNVIDKEDRSMSFGLFQWVCLAVRPLTVTELRHALISAGKHLVRKDPSYADALDMVDTDKRMRLRIKPLSGGLIEVASRDTNSEEYVQVCHQSINDFMLAEGLALSACLDASTVAPSPTTIILPKAHDIVLYCQARLYWTCLEYLATDAVMEKMLPDYLTSDVRQKLLRSLPFIEYTTLYVFVHAEAAGTYRSNNLLEETTVLQRVLPKWLEFQDRIVQICADVVPEESQILHIASRANMEDMTEHLLREGCDVDVRDGSLCTALHLAVERGHQAIADLLLRSGADINADDRSYRTVLVYATSRGRIPMVQWLLGRGAQLASPTTGQSDAFLEAASRGNVELIKLFLASGAQVNAREGRYSSVLQVAAHHGHDQAVRVLLSAGAEVNMDSDHFGTALQAASNGGHEKAVKILLGAGADVNVQAGGSCTALQGASFGRHAHVVRLLLDAGADVNVQEGRHWTALQAAHGGPLVTQMLLEAGAEVNQQGGFYGNALQSACVAGITASVRMLLDHGANVNAKGGRHGTALRGASWEGHDEIVQMLLDAGADPTVQGGL